MSSLPTSIERTRFYQEYRQLGALLATFYDPNGKTDVQIAGEYLQECDVTVAEEILAEGQRFMSQQQLPLSLIRKCANRYLVTEAEQRQWLQTLLDRVQAELEARKKGHSSQAT